MIFALIFLLAGLASVFIALFMRFFIAREYRERKPGQEGIREAIDLHYRGLENFLLSSNLFFAFGSIMLASAGALYLQERGFKIGVGWAWLLLLLGFVLAAASCRFLALLGKRSPDMYFFEKQLESLGEKYAGGFFRLLAILGIVMMAGGVSILVRNS